MGKTFVEKIFTKKAKKDVCAGEIVSVEPDFVMSHDNAAAISRTFKKIGVKNVKYPERVVIILDHEIPAPKESSAINHKEIREFVKEQGISNFFDINNGDPLEIDEKTFKVSLSKGSTNKDLSINIDQKIMSKLFSLSPIFDIIPILISAACLGGILYLIMIMSSIIQ